MNDTLNFIKQRYSCRDFSDRSPSDQQIDAIVRAAIESPSGRNRQLWQVIVVKNRALISEMEEEGMRMLKLGDEKMYEVIMSRNGTLFYHAPIMIMIAVKQATPPGAELVDLGIIAQNTVIAATSLGLASLHCGLAGFCFAGEKAEEFKRKLEFPEGYECGLAVLIGFAKTSGAPHKPDLSKITYIQ